MDASAHIQTVDPQNSLLAIRPDYGNQSPKGSDSLWANYFQMNLTNKLLVLYLYTIYLETFDSDSKPLSEAEKAAPTGKKLVQIIRCGLRTPTFNKVQSDIATNFSNMLTSCRKLGNDQIQTDKFKFWAENEIRNGIPRPRSNALQYRMTLKQNGELRISDLLDYLASGTQGRGANENISQIIQALDMILCYRSKLDFSNVATPKKGKCFPIGANTDFFNLTRYGAYSYLQGVRGFFASVRASTDRTLVNCNACCGVFYQPGSLVTLYNSFLPANPSSYDYKRLQSAIRGLRVQPTQPQDSPVRTIFGLTRDYEGPRKASFTAEDGIHYTVEKYWAKKGKSSPSQ